MSLIIWLIGFYSYGFDLKSEVEFYQKRYPLKSVQQKLVDNSGNGFDQLYGARNVRVVLNGVYYRGGANNVNNKYGERSNMNPLPDIGLENLCAEGFGLSIYFYNQNYESAPPLTRCTHHQLQTSHQLDYVQITAAKQQNHRELLQIIFNRIQGQIAGPIYGHCWNGWHASGLIAALALRQYCDWSADQALRYWEQNTDGNSKGFASIKSYIKNFVPYRDLQITKEQQELICPGG